MKNSFLFIFLLLVFGMGIVSSVDIEIKDSVKKGENFIVKVSGKFYKPLSKDNIKFRRGNSNPEFGILKLEKIEGDYYFYLTVPEERLAGNYTMVFEDSEYYSGTSIITEDIVKEFEVTSETVPFTILPPLIITSDKYTVTIQNLMQETININIEKGEKITLESGEVIVESPSFFDLLFGRVPDQEVIEETEEITELSGITLVSGEIKEIEYPSPTFSGFEKLNLYYNGEGYSVLVYNPEEVSQVVVDEEPNDEDEGEEIIIIIEDDDEILENITNEANDSTPTDIEGVKTCVEMGGKVCAWESELCQGETTNAKNSQCCIGKCVAIEKSSNGKIIGWSIIGVVALFLTWFFKNKYKKAAPGRVDLIKRSRPKI